MITAKYNNRLFLGVMLILALTCLMPLNALATDCGDCNPLDEAVPPFLSAGPDPNLLLMIDNSASMLDLAYTGDSNTCYEEFDAAAYDPNTVNYAGYFDVDTWYKYDFNLEKFVADTSDCSGSTYYNDYLCVNVTTGTIVDAGTGTSYTVQTGVDQFKATGNLLNWIAASKLDVQKKVLTGGKYDSTDSANPFLKMETRGCGNRRYVKKIAVTDRTDSSTTYVSLAVRPPRAATYDTWRANVAYAEGDVVWNYDGTILYQATAGGTSDATATSPTDDGNITWQEYWQTRWHNGTYYAKGSLVTNPGDANTIDKGRVYIATTGGTASGTGVSDDTGVSWELYDLTHIEIFKIYDGFNIDACQTAIDYIQAGDLGQSKQYVKACMERTVDEPEPTSYGNGSTDAYSVFNNSMHACWYQEKQQSPFPDGDVNTIMTQCAAIYADVESGALPWELIPEDLAYVCFGEYTGDIAKEDGFVGNCWSPGETCSYSCVNGKEYPDGCNANQVKVTCAGGEPGWSSAGFSSPEACARAGIERYCQGVKVPEVIDPSDQVGNGDGDSDVNWGIPALLIDSGIVAQLDQPIAVMKGFIQQDAAPEGLIQEYTDDIRIGAMIFNDSGSDSECDQEDPFVLYECTNANNKDGGKVIEPIGQSAAHTAELVTAINDIKANSWTPLAEAFYNAIGYFKQNTSIRLNNEDFTVGAGTNPIQYWCQNNNILIITEGASTADTNTPLNNLPSGAFDTDDDSSSSLPSSLNCGSLDGSTLLDDLAWYAHYTEDLIGKLNVDDEEFARTIDTHIVATGSLRTTGTGECSPDTLLTATAQNGGTTVVQRADDVNGLEAALRRAFSSILKRASAGSAASVISATRSGEGAVYQAIFWPALDGPTVNGIPQPDAKWAGEVHSLLVDAHGLLYEDTDGDLALSAGDQRVIFYFDESSEETLACYGTVANGVCSGTIKDLTEVNYLWSASEWLAGVDNTAILTNRSTYISADKNRYIFTWNDRDNDGVVDSNEVLPFTDTNDWNGISVNPDRRKVPHDFGILTDDTGTNDEVDQIVNWVRGLDSTGLRSRQVAKPASFNVTPSADNTITWRLGDVIYSTPTAVGKPAEGYHLTNQDESYADFAAAYRNRRQMVYFGGNDGMIHALNGGFFYEDQDKYCRSAGCTAEDTAPELGAEMWAYVPYNLQPNLKCLLNEDYNHRYYADLKPRIFDVQIFSDDSTHPNGWGTIMVAGMRLGGSPVNAVGNGSGGDADTRIFTSAYMIFDITNPEVPPTLLGELTYKEGYSASMGYTTPVPTVVPMKNGSVSKWYLVLGSGPTTMKGESTQDGTVGVFPLGELTSASPAAFRIPNALPTATNEKGRWTVGTGFISDLITVDFDLDKDYMGDVVYFGTVEGTWGNWSGKMYRIPTNANTSMTKPNAWTAPTVLIDPGRPITAAPSIGYDGSNYWVYFGTGRFFDKDDKTETAQNYFFGIKEPLDCVGTTSSFNWDPVTFDPNAILPNLWRTDQILVQESTQIDNALLSCVDGTTSCLPTGITTLKGLIGYIGGEACPNTSSVEGWYQHLPETGERNLGQPTLLGGLLTYTSYVPFDDICRPDGESYLSALYYQTGTSWHQGVFESSVAITQTDPATVVSRLEIGHGLASTPNLHVGREEGAKAFVQTSTGAIVEIEQPNLPLSNVKSGRIHWRAD